MDTLLADYGQTIARLWADYRQAFIARLWPVWMANILMERATMDGDQVCEGVRWLLQARLQQPRLIQEDSNV